MRFVEVDFFGLYLAPIVPILFAALIAFLLLRRATQWLEPLRRVWHPALFELAVYVILVSSLVLAVGRWSL